VFSYVLMSVRCVLVLVLAVSTIGKLWHRSELAEFGRTLRVGLRLPRARLVAGAWVGVEGVTAIALALPRTAAPAAVLAAGVFGCLTAGAALLVTQHRGFACTCFGSRSRLSWWTVLRNGALTAAALLLAAALTVLLGAVLIWQAGPLGVLLRQSGVRHPAGRPATPTSVLSGGRR